MPTGKRFTRSFKPKAVWSRPPRGHADSGQRFVVTYRDGLGTRRAYGFTNDQAEADRWLKEVREKPAFTKGRIEDRQKSTDERPDVPAQSSGSNS